MAKELGAESESCFFLYARPYQNLELFGMCNSRGWAVLLPHLEGLSSVDEIGCFRLELCGPAGAVESGGVAPRPGGRIEECSRIVRARLSRAISRPK